MSTSKILSLLRSGAVITRGSFSGYWLQPRDGKRVRITPAQAREVIPLCTQTDDRKSRCGETWALCDCQSPPTHISNGCQIHNENPVFYEE